MEETASTEAEERESKKMTVQKKRTISVEDIKAFEITCTACGSTLSIPVNLKPAS